MNPLEPGTIGIRGIGRNKERSCALTNCYAISSSRALRNKPPAVSLPWIGLCVFLPLKLNTYLNGVLFPEKRMLRASSSSLYV